MENTKLLVIALDGLEHDLVIKFNLKNLIQKEYGKTDLSLIRQKSKYPCTVDIWSTFLAGKFKHRIINSSDTFLKYFRSYVVLDLPGFKKNLSFQHKRLVNALKNALEHKLSYVKFEYLVKFDALKRMTLTFKKLKNNPEILISYFPTADLLGHLYFNNEAKMLKVYRFLDDIVSKIKKKIITLIISDHGMIPWYRKKRGEHSWHGFYSINRELNLKNPKIEDFYHIILKLRKKGEAGNFRSL